MKRKGSAHWEGTGKEGGGTVSTASGVLKDKQYSHASRFADGIGTNPEELIAAAHAGCFSMKLSFVLGEKGITPKSIDSECTVAIEAGTITSSHIDVAVDADGLSEGVLKEAVAEAFANCPVSKLLNTEKTVTSRLA